MAAATVRSAAGPTCQVFITTSGLELTQFQFKLLLSTRVRLITETLKNIFYSLL